MNIGDTLNIILEVEPPCHCPEGWYRGDEVMTCPAHGLSEYKQSNTIKEIKGTALGFCKKTSFSPATVIVACGVGKNLQFELDTGTLFMFEGAWGNIVSMKLDLETIRKRDNS